VQLVSVVSAPAPEPEPIPEAVEPEPEPEPERVRELVSAANTARNTAELGPTKGFVPEPLSRDQRRWMSM
jgi:hypothetical protein